jgi:hypothetical protein
MGFVVIRCPEDGEPVYTGLQMDPGPYQEAVLRDYGMVCPRCGRVHVWSKEDSWLELLEIS